MTKETDTGNNGMASHRDSYWQRYFIHTPRSIATAVIGVFITRA